MGTNKEKNPKIEGCFLTVDNEKQLRKIFKDKESYTKVMQTLWMLRDASLKDCEIKTSSVIRYDKSRPSYKFSTLANKLIEALSQDDIIFTRGRKGEIAIYDRTKD